VENGSKSLKLSHKLNTFIEISLHLVFALEVLGLGTATQRSIRHVRGAKENAQEVFSRFDFWTSFVRWDSMCVVGMGKPSKIFTAILHGTKNAQ
jgi:hypothetical protein